MGTYTVITITGPNEDLAKVKLHKLPDFEGHDGTEWTLVATVSRRVVDKQDGHRILEMHYEYDPIEDHFIQTDFSTKWSPEEAGSWAMKFTAKRPTLNVNIREEWDDRDADDPGIDDCTYRGGEWIRSESKINGEVPYDLGEMLNEGVAALAAAEAAAEGDSNDAEIQAWQEVGDAFHRLIKGLL